MSPATHQLTDNELLYFLHIPKTAGTSFVDILKQHFDPSLSSYSVPVEDFLKRSPDMIAQYRAISGHYFYNIQEFTPRPPVYITMLRDPLERTISIYSHKQRDGVNGLDTVYEKVKSQSLLDFVTDPSMLHLYANLQTRYLAADPNIHKMAKKISPEMLKRYELERQIDGYAPNGFSDSALLEKAQERLRQFAFVGLAEQFDEAVEVLCYTFGWTVPPAFKVKNVSPNRPPHEDIPQEAIDIIRENTQLDAALYETGKQLFNAHYEQMLQDHPEKRPDPIQLNDPIAKMQREVDFQKRLISTLQEEKQQEKRLLEKRVRTLTEVIDQIEASFGWRLILRVNKLRLKIIPKGSKREQIYLKIRGR